MQILTNNPNINFGIEITVIPYEKLIYLLSVWEKRKSEEGLITQQRFLTIFQEIKN